MAAFRVEVISSEALMGPISPNSSSARSPAFHPGGWTSLGIDADACGKVGECAAGVNCC